MVRLIVTLLIPFLLSSAHSSPLVRQEAASPTEPPPLLAAPPSGLPFALSSSSGPGGTSLIPSLLAGLLGPSLGGVIVTGSGTADAGIGSGLAFGPGLTSALGIGAPGIGLGSATADGPTPSPEPTPATSASPSPATAPPTPSAPPETPPAALTTENGLEDMAPPATSLPSQALNQTSEVLVGVADLPGDGIAAVSSVNVTESDGIDSASGSAAAISG